VPRVRPKKVVLWVVPSIPGLRGRTNRTTRRARGVFDHHGSGSLLLVVRPKFSKKDPLQLDSYHLGNAAIIYDPMKTT